MAVLTDDALVTWEYVQGFLGDASAPFDADDREFGIGLINAASSRANDIARRKLRGRTATVTLDGTGTDIVVLPEYPVAEVTDVRVDITRTFPDSSAITGFDYYEDGRLFVPARVPAQRRCVRVAYTAGYDPVPHDLMQAVVEVVAYSWKRLRSRAIGTSSVTADGVTTQFEIDIPMPARRVFESYRRTDA